MNVNVRMGEGNDNGNGCPVCKDSDSVLGKLFLLGIKVGNFDGLVVASTINVFAYQEVGAIPYPSIISDFGGYSVTVPLSRFFRFGRHLFFFAVAAASVRAFSAACFSASRLAASDSHCFLIGFFGSITNCLLERVAGVERACLSMYARYSSGVSKYVPQPCTGALLWWPP